MTKFNLFFSVPAFPGISIIVNYFFWLHTYSKLFSIPGCIQKRTKNVAGIRKKNMFYSWIYECILLTCLTNRLPLSYFVSAHRPFFSSTLISPTCSQLINLKEVVSVLREVTNIKLKRVHIWRQAFKRYFSVVILFSIGILSWHLFDFSDCILMRLDNWEIILGYDRELSACFVRSP